MLSKAPYTRSQPTARRAVLATRAAVLFTAAMASAVLAEPVASSGDRFVDATDAAGLSFIQFNGMTGQLYLPEIMGSGGALLDYDRDSDLDLFLVQGAELGPAHKDQPPLFPLPAASPAGHRLFRNELIETGRLQFTDVSSGLSGAHGEVPSDYGMGAAVGDIDNDGLPDIYVTARGPNRLFHNRGNGRFEEIGRAAGVDDPRWSISAAFIDYDRDGWQDLYVGNYLDIDLANYRVCRSPTSAVDYCGPAEFPPQADRLYHNRGDGTFEEVSRRSGIGLLATPSLGVSVADFNGDQRPDLYIANDGKPNQLWLNQGDGRFVDDAMMAGAAVNMEGAAEASMGVDAGDFDGDGDPDLFMTHINRETHTLYVNDGSGWFEDRTLKMGLAAASKPYTGFGTVWLDVDADGWLDLFVANGEVNRIRAFSEQDPYPLHQPNQLLMNRQGNGFDDLSGQAGRVFSLSEVSRGAAAGDLDNDGDPDLLLVNNNGPARLLLNQWPTANHWIGLQLLLANGADAVGARVEVVGRERRQWRRSRSDGSYASANDPRVLVGLGPDPGPVAVTVTWPDGQRQAWTALAADRYHRLVQARPTAGPHRATPR